MRLTIVKYYGRINDGFGADSVNYSVIESPSM